MEEDAGWPDDKTQVSRKLEQMRYCWFCGAPLGVIEDRHYDRNDTCGKAECEREMRHAAQDERAEAHERLDHDRGW